MPKTTIWLIRHGESAANAGVATRFADLIPLTKRGHQQAELVATALPIAPDLIITSSYLRAKETSEPTIKLFESTRVEKWPVQEFTYLSLRELGETTAAARRPLVETYWDRCDVDYCDGDEAESFSGFIQRARTAIYKLRSLQHHTIAVFSHGQFIRAIIWLLLTGRGEIDSTAMKEFEHFLTAVPFPNAAIVTLSFAGNDFSLGPIIRDHLI